MASAEAALIVEQPNTLLKSPFRTQKDTDKSNKIFCKRKARATLIPGFKTSANCSAKDIDEIRKLLTRERLILLAGSGAEQEAALFWSIDYARMMRDDWLVSRFLLRGQKRQNCGGDETPSSSILYANTMELIRECAKFRYEFRINGLTDRREFFREWLDVDGLFSYKPDKAGNPTIYLRVKLHRVKLIETSELRHQFKRLLLYHLESCDRELTNKPGRGICCVFDLSQATLENLDVELVSWMFRSFKSCGPKLLSYIIVYNIPWFLKAALKLLFGTILARSNQQRMKFVYGDEVLDYIDRENLPPYIRL